MNRWLLTLIVTGCLWAAYRGYARWMGPLTEPLPAPPVAEVTSVPLPVQPEEFAPAERLLSKIEWTKTAKFKIKHGDVGYFYFNEKPTEGPRVQLKPFAMVFRLDDNPNGPPYTIVCDSAHLTFTRDFQIGGESPGRIIGAMLEGNFQITGPNALLVTGKDCRFSEENHQLYSDNPIEFQYRPENGNVRVVRGTADKLQVNFVPSTFSPHGRDMPRVGDIESLVLRRNVEFFFRYLQGTEQVTTRVNSAGPFEFDFLKNIATFSEQVEINRPTKNSKGEAGIDRMKADWLALEFTERQSEPPPAHDGSIGGRAIANAPPDESDSPLGKLQLNRLYASSRSMERPLTLTSSSANFTGKMLELIYNAPLRTLDMQASGHDVQLENGDATLTSPTFQVQHTVEGELAYVEANRQGQLDFQRSQQADKPPERIQAHWKHRLTMTPHPSEKISIVTLEGDARVLQSNGVGIQSDRLTFDIDSEGMESARAPGLPGVTAAGAATSAPPAPASASKQKDQQLPIRRALAEGHVVMAGPTFEVMASRLDATFQSGKLPKGPTGKPKGQVELAPLQTAILSMSAPGRGPVSHQRQRSDLIPTSARIPGEAMATGEQSFASVPDPLLVQNGRPAGSAPNRLPGGIDTDSRWEIHARSIDAAILIDPDTEESDVREVIGVGDVLIRQLPPVQPLISTIPAAPKELLTVTGDRLHLVNSGAVDQAIHLTGVPAVLRQGGIKIEGNELYFDREANTARVLGKGMLQSPVQQGLGGEKKTTSSQLDVHWMREMIFDGNVARFIEGVRTRLDDSVMRCDEMHVTLNHRVDFTSDKPDTEGLGIQNVDCLRGVEVEFLQWADPQNLAARAEGRAARFELRYDTGDFLASGGGRLEIWQKREESRVDVAPPAAARANQPITTSTLPWQYTQVIFHDRIHGNMHRKTATLHDRVWLTHAPVERAMQKFTRDDLSKDTESAKNGIWMGCDELQMSIASSTTQDRGAIQILGIGKHSRVELEGRLFQANSDTLSYDETTKMFTLRGYGQNKVSVARQEYPGGRYSEASFQTIQFNPASRSGSLQGSDGVSGAP